MTPVRFTALADFYSEDLASHYVAGLSYTATEADQVLLALLKRWEGEGKIMFGGGAAIMQGKE